MPSPHLILHFPVVFRRVVLEERNIRCSRSHRSYRRFDRHISDVTTLYPGRFSGTVLWAVMHDVFPARPLLLPTTSPPNALQSSATGEYTSRLASHSSCFSPLVCGAPGCRTLSFEDISNRMMGLTVPVVGVSLYEGRGLCSILHGECFDTGACACLYAVFSCVHASFGSTIRVDIMVASTQVQVTTVQEFIEAEALVYVLPALTGSSVHYIDRCMVARHAEFYYLLASSGNVCSL